MFFYDKKDYQIEKSGDWYRVSKPDSYSTEGHRMFITRFADFDSAVRFITKFTTAEPYPSTYFNATCSCGYVSEGWKFVETDGICFEICNKCNQPLYQQDTIRLNKKSLEDFDMEAFLNM